MEQTSRLPFFTHHKPFRPPRHRNSFALSLAIRCLRVMMSNLSTQFRSTQSRNTWFLPLPAPRADRTLANDSEKMLPPPITHYTVYEKTRNLQRKHVCLSMVNTFVPGRSTTSSRGQTLFWPIAVKGCFALYKICNGSNGAISFHQKINRILFYICNGRHFRVEKKTKRGSGNHRVYCSLNDEG